MEESYPKGDFLMLDVGIQNRISTPGLSHTSLWVEQEFLKTLQLNGIHFNDEYNFCYVMLTRHK